MFGYSDSHPHCTTNIGPNGDDVSDGNSFPINGGGFAPIDPDSRRVRHSGVSAQARVHQYEGSISMHMGDRFKVPRRNPDANSLPAEVESTLEENDIRS